MQDAEGSGVYGDRPPAYGTATYGKDATLADLSFEDRFPSASRGDVMAGRDELEALGIQYEHIEN